MTLMTLNNFIQICNMCPQIRVFSGFFFFGFFCFCFVFVLFCFVLFCFVLFCFVLFCFGFVLFCFVLFCFVLYQESPAHLTLNYSVIITNYIK